MKKEITVLKKNDWSINLEDSFYEENYEELLNAAIDAVRSTERGYYVNVVAPASIGNPEDKLIPDLSSRLYSECIPIDKIRYVDQCGCGGM